MSSLREIAHEAGVSIATVSRVINDVDRNKVSEDTRGRVLEIARALRYRPNPQAVSLVRRNPLNTLGLYVPYNSHVFDSFYFTEIIRGAVDAANARGLNITLFVPSRDSDARSPADEMVRRSGVAGLLLIGTTVNDPITARLRDGRLPFVVANNSSTTPDVTTVDCDNVSGAMEATRHLIRLGHRRIAFVAGPNTSSNANDRLQGYRLGMSEAGLTIDEALLAHGGFEEPGGREAMRSILAQGPPPTAVFAANDAMAIGAMKVCKRHGLGIPSDIAVVGFDDVPMAEHVEPALTTVHQPIYQVGRRAAESLIGRVMDDGEDDLTAATHLVLRTRLVVRESCGGRPQRAT